jgi:hypothetical protein
VRRNFHFGIELHRAGVEALEQQIKRHDLGERGRMTAPIGIVGGERRAGIAVYDDGRECRVVAFACLLVLARMTMPGTARIGGIGCENDRGGDREQPENATRRTREEAKVVRSIYFPVPISILITGS